MARLLTRACRFLRERLRMAAPGGVAEWLKAADCKSARASVRWFEPSPLHQLSFSRASQNKSGAWRECKHGHGNCLGRPRSWSARNSRMSPRPHGRGAPRKKLVKYCCSNWQSAFGGADRTDQSDRGRGGQRNSSCAQGPGSQSSGGGEGRLEAHLARQYREDLNRTLHWRVIMNTSRAPEMRATISRQTPYYHFGQLGRWG